MTSGGKRKGAGRPPVHGLEKKIPYATKLRPDLVRWLRSQRNAAAILERIIEDEINWSAWRKRTQSTIGEKS